VPLDHFRTQVLLLHSSQSTLDRFSAGFGDRYTVHCATSGSEALSTLGETPIHVIVSAQKLPGMSGAEALREAKKRSPDTIGILLAGDDEALVGANEVFQVVRGGVEPADLRRLIDNATQQTRLLALAESANDTTAHPDEPVSEHIIMETSENGSSIITDATGQMPALDPKKIPPSAAVGAATVDVLVITKDQEFLTTIRESSRGMHSVHYANTLKQAEDAVRKNRVGVAVVDAAMVGENVEKLTQHLRGLQRRLVAIVAGRRDDGEMLMDLINRGKVYRFLLKPVSPGRARLAVEASVKHHLEAPDSAFKPVAGPAPARPAAPAPRPQQSATPRTAPAKAVNSKPAPAAPAAQKKAAPSPAITASKNDALVRIDEDLSGAFGDDSSFTETVTGLVSTVAKSLKGPKKSKDGPTQAATPAPPAAPELPGRAWELASFLSPTMLGIAAVVLVAIAGAGFWVFGGADGTAERAEAPAPVASVSEGTPDFGNVSATAGQRTVDVDELLEEARLARDAGQIFNPPGNNAIELYMAAVSAAPDNAYAAAELDATLDEALGMAETALLERRAEDATAALTRVRLANPAHPRLPFLTAQVAQMQLRDHVDAARAAIRDGRLEDATTAIANARALGVQSAGEIDALEDELRAARSERRVDEVLSLANQRLEEGSLTSPANDNARYYFQLALGNDPGNTAAQTGLTVVASKIVLQARAEIDGGRFNTAEALLAEARQLDPQSAELAASTRALSDARQRAEEERQRAANEKRAAERRAEEAQRLEAERQAAAQREAEARRQEAAAAAGAAAVAADSAANGTPETVAADEAADEVTGAVAATPTGDGAEEPVKEQSVAEPAEPAKAVSAREQTPVAASSLTRTKYVAPKYPRSAERRNVSGWVDVVFTVTRQGEVTDIEVIGSEPGDTFVDAATRAVEKWEFEPVVENGAVVEKRAGVRMMFALQ